MELTFSPPHSFIETNRGIGFIEIIGNSALAMNGGVQSFSVIDIKNKKTDATYKHIDGTTKFILRDNLMYAVAGTNGLLVISNPK